jgi:hypothetical protein
MTITQTQHVKPDGTGVTIALKAYEAGNEISSALYADYVIIRNCGVHSNFRHPLGWPITSVDNFKSIAERIFNTSTTL